MCPEWTYIEVDMLSIMYETNIHVQLTAEMESMANPRESRAACEIQKQYKTIIILNVNKQTYSR